MMTQVALRKSAGETPGTARPPQDTPRTDPGQRKSGPSRQGGTPVQLGNQEEGPESTAGDIGETQVVDVIGSPASGDGAAEFFKTEDIATYSVYQSVAGLTERSDPATWDMMIRIVAANRAVLDAAEALLSSKQLSIARAKAGAA